MVGFLFSVRNEMQGLPVAARVYILSVFAVALLAAALSALLLGLGAQALITIGVLAGLIALLDTFPVIIRKDQVEFTISTAVKVGAVLLLSPPVIILSIFSGTVLAEIRAPRPSFKKLFNVGSMTCVYTVLIFVYQLVHDPNSALIDSPRDVLALALLGVSDLVLNSFTVSLVIALATGSSLRYIWSENFRPVIWHDLSLVPLGAFLALLWRFSPWAVIFASVPLVLIRYSYQMVSDLRRQTLDALMALARVLDERDEHTHRHCEMVANHATEIGRAMGLAQGEIEIIQRAAYLHDIGKVGMPNEILFKPDILTLPEREQAKKHAQIGGELLEKFPLFERGAQYVRYHHERWDGKGYPDGLKGASIPLGARIVSVADSFQAMIEDRPYRKGLGLEFALEQLELNSGTQFDPAVVQALYTAKGQSFPKQVTAPEALTVNAQPA